MPAAVCERGNPVADPGGNFENPDASFRLDERSRGGETGRQEERPYTQQP
jgi:hypothetical protein